MSEPPSPRVAYDDGWNTISTDRIDLIEELLRRDENIHAPLPGEPEELGSHLLIEMYDCDADALSRESCVGAAMREAAEKSLATVVAQSFHEFKPYGVSGAVIIQESHYTIHTWPEHRFAAVDLFYCGGTVQVSRAIEVLKTRFGAGRMRFMIVRRGLQAEVLR